jgi:drug/metabolite transporter (DMT)-like permease
MAHVVTTALSPSTVAARPSLRGPLVASLFAVYVIWGSTYLGMQVALEQMQPLMMASLRFVIAGSIVLAIALRRGARWPSARDWLRMLPVGAFLFVGGTGFVALAEQSVPSSGAAVVCATMPLWVGVLGAFVGARPSFREWGALVLGFAGVLVLMGGPTLAGEPADIAFAIGSPILWAIGSLLARRTKDIGGEHAMTVGPALQMLTGGLLLAVGSQLHGEPLPLHAGAKAWLAIAYLVSVGSLIGFTAYMWLLRNARPAVATSYAFVNPILGVLIGAALHGEPLGWTTLVANIMIVGAVMLVLLRPRS